jgi:hypothetical protein
MKRIGRYTKSPRNSDDAKPSYAAAKIVDDAINFHGAKLAVKVHHAYPSRHFKNRINIAAGRHVVLVENGIEVWIDDYLVTVRLLAEKLRRKKSHAPPPYGGSADELPKRLLASFPVIYSYHRDGTFEGITIFPGRGKPTKPRRRAAKHRRSLP